jgi:S-adenosylmethionine decarboxylase
MGMNASALAYGDIVKRVLRCFGPSEFSVAVTIFGGRGHGATWGKKLEAEAYDCNNTVEQALPCGGVLIYQSFTANEEVAVSAGSPRSVFHCFEGENNAENHPLVKEGKLANLLAWRADEDDMEDGVLC